MLSLLRGYSPDKDRWFHTPIFSVFPFSNKTCLESALGEVGAQHAAPLRQFILEKTEGNPFFMEEIVQELREQGILTRSDVGADLRVGPQGPGAPTGAPLPIALRIPTTVQGVLAARIDRLPPEEKVLLQTLAVIGKEFSWSLLKQVVDQPEDQLQLLLSRLQTAEFIYEQPAFPDIEYVFKHALTQEVAYSSLLHERRKDLHESAARAIEEVYRYKIDDHYSELAYHYSRSGNTKKAVEYLHLAGQQAVQRSAYVEALNHFTAALESLKMLPDTPQRIQRELQLQISLGPSVISTKGYGAPEVKIVYSRARELCEQSGDERQMFPALWGLWQFLVNSGDHLTAYALGEQLLTLAEKLQDPTFLLEAHYTLTLTALCRGEHLETLEHGERGFALYDPQQQHAHILSYGQDSGLHCLGCAGWSLWYLGYPHQALEKILKMLSLAQDTALPYSQAAALVIATMTHQCRLEGKRTQETAEATIVLSTEYGFPYWLAFASFLRGWAVAEQGNSQEGINLMQQSLTAWRDTGSELFRPYLLALLAEVHGKMGQPEKGLNAIAEAMDIMNKNGERHYEAELYRLKGELLLQQEKQKPVLSVEGARGENE